jgi:hypothetical protein
MDKNRSGHGFYADLPVDERMRELIRHIDPSHVKNAETPVSIDDLANSIHEYKRLEGERARAELREDCENSSSQCESERVLAAAPDWSVWNGLSFVAFRDLTLLREINDENGLDELDRNGHRSLKAHDPERLLLSALVRDQLRAIRNGEELKPFYWYGKTKVNRDVWLDRDAMLKIFPADSWSLDQMMIWHITRDPQRVENAFRMDRASAALLFKKRPQIQIETAAREIAQRCREGLISSVHAHSELTLDDWRDLKIEFNEGLLQCAGSSDVSIAFSPADALLQFPPDKKFNDHQVQDDCGRQNPALAREIVRNDADSGGHEHGSSPKLLGRMRLSKRPLNPKNERPIIATAAWDTIGLHEKWATEGIPLSWSDQMVGREVNAYFSQMVRSGKLDPKQYDFMRPNKDGAYNISPDTICRRALERKQPSNPAGN